MASSASSTTSSAESASASASASSVNNGHDSQLGRDCGRMPAYGRGSWPRSSLAAVPCADAGQ